MKKLFIVGLFLLVLTGCSNQVSEHSKAIDKLFTSEETASSSSSSSTDTSESATTPSSSRTTPSSSRKYYITTPSTNTTVSPAEREMMTDILRERGIISDSTILPDAVLKQLYNSQGISQLDPKLWKAVLAKRDFKDLDEQIKPQYEETDKDQKNYKYKVNVWLPALEEIDPEELSIKIDEIDYARLNSDSGYLMNYSKSIDEAVEKSLIKQLESDKKVKMKKFTVNVTVKDDNEKVTATFNDDGLTPVQQTVSNSKNSFMTDSKDLDAQQQVKLLSNLKTNLKRDVPSAVAPKISKITKQDDDQYKVKLLLVDNLEDTLKKIKDTTNEEYKKNNPNGLFATVLDTSIRTKLNQKLQNENLKHTIEKEIIVKPEGDAMSLPQTGTNEANIETKKQIDQTVTDIKTYVQDNVMKKPEERPASGVLVGANTGTPVAIHTLASATNDYYVKFNNTDNTDTILSAYIRGGEQLTVNLPPGTYKLRFSRGQGDKWYGAVNGFGPTARSSQSRNPITVGSGGSYTLRLYSVTGGNLPIDGVNSGTF